jgi:hypothetical protein
MKRVVFDGGFFYGLLEGVEVFVGLDLKWHFEYG